MREITVEEFMKRYGKEKVVFSNYYKYMFCHKGKTKEGDEIVVFYGGCSDDIYRHEVTAGLEEHVAYIDPCWGYVSRNGKKIHEFDDR